MELKNKNNNDLEVLVNVPPSDGELFASLLTGERLSKEPVKMTIREYNHFKRTVNLLFAATIFIGGIGVYQSISEEIEKHGSLKNAYNYQMELLDKAPLNGLYP